jgi:3-deoxy-manno-octulosonate cytidylyltransferase (CMP-KDO synthetase)
MPIIGIIPARYASTRFPGKPLADIKGKSMLQRVYEQSKKSWMLDEVIVATDDERIAKHAKDFGAKVIMTRSDHPSGTDRCYEAYRLNGKRYDYIINVQGDEPFLDPKQIDELVEICDGRTEIATQMARCNSHEVLFDPAEVKIVMNGNREAIYFSRSVVPYLRNYDPKEWHERFEYYRHVGMYAFRSDVLEKLSKLKLSKLEKAESLEQLRWLEHGHKIRCVETEYESYCIDEPGDIEKVLKHVKVS